MVQSVLTAGTDPLTLTGERAIPTATAWQEVLRPVLTGVRSAHFTVPSWWSDDQCALLTEAAAVVGATAQTGPRTEVLAAAVVVEIAPSFVLVIAGGAIQPVPRCADPPVLAERVCELVRAALSEDPAPVAIDCPPGVPGGPALQNLIDAALTAADIAVAETECAVVESAVRSPRFRWVAATGAVLIVGCAGLALVQRYGQPQYSTLVEGRVAIEVPSGWGAVRVADGPGSARVELRAPADPELALHLTQVMTPDADLAATADTLRAALATQPPDIFGEFVALDHRAGRAAVTYRERRPPHDVRWTVLVDNRVRIAIGCQYPRQRSTEIDAICERAVRTARRIG